MSTVQQLVSELTNLISQTKRKNTDLRQDLTSKAAENTLQVLKSYTPTIGEKVFLESLHGNPDFISPFLIACSTRNAKYCASAVHCLHLLLNFRSVAVSSLKDVIDALGEAAHLGVEIQLKILQTLPSLLQSYEQDLHMGLLVDFLQLCSILQSGNKVSVVVNTAAATLQQLIIAIFDRVTVEDQNLGNIPGNELYQVTIDGDEKIKVGPSAHDALLIFTDLCNLTEKQKPTFLKFTHLVESFGLELLESILTNHSAMFIKHEELGFVMRTRVVPLLLRAFSEKREFSITVRVTRILYLLVRRELSALKVECEVILSLMTHMISPDAAPYWKRVLCMEVFQGIISDFDLVTELFEEYDNQDSRRPIIKGLLEAFDNISKENPMAMGVSTYSAAFQMPSQPYDDSSGAPISIPLDTPGISISSSTLRVPCIDLLDKADPPAFPMTYIYYLALSCVNSFSDGLARSVASLSYASSNAVESTDQSFASNGKPSGRHNHKKRVQKILPKSRQSDILMKLTTTCWCSLRDSLRTFFLASIEIELYHSLVRAVQRVAHTSGILELSQPRDEFMLLLAQFSIAVAPQKNSMVSPTKSSSGSLLTMEGIVGTIGSTLQQKSTGMSNYSSSTPSGQSQIALITSRNILCIRALLNIAIALGNSLHGTWSLVFETLQAFDRLVNSREYLVVQIGDFPSFGKARADLNTVDSSVRRLLEFTKDLDEQPFYDMLKSLCDLSVQTIGIGGEDFDIKTSGLGDISQEDPMFLLSLLGEVTTIGFSRFSAPYTSVDSWQFSADFLLRLVGTKVLNQELRLGAANIVNNASMLVCVETTDQQKAHDTLKIDAASSIQRKTIQIIYKGIEKVRTTGDSELTPIDLDIHVLAIENLQSILEKCGSRLTKSWDVVFDIIGTVFTESILKGKSNDSTKLIKVGFECLQLICNDFMDCLPNDCLIRVIETLYLFCQQLKDLNISFTSISLFWNISDHLRKTLQEGDSDIKEPIESEQQLSGLIESDSMVTANWSLWVIVLLRLADISIDRRPQVRNGAAQILFRIFDTCGAGLPPNIWKTCHKIVLPKVMILPPETSTPTPKEWMETVGLILEGISSMYASFIGSFIESFSDFDRLWTGLTSWWRDLVNLGNPVISQSVYLAVYTVLANISSKKDLNLSAPALETVWQFWKSQNVPETVYDAKATQESLTTLVNIFEPLYNISQDKMTDDNLIGSFNLLESCASFSVSPMYTDDKYRMTPLQSASHKQLSAIELSSPLAVSLFCKSSSNLSSLCLSETKAVSEEDGKPPSYTNLSYTLLQSLVSNVAVITDNGVFGKLCNDGTVEYVLEKMVLILESKFKCPVFQPSVKITDRQLWQLSTSVFLDLVEKVVEHAGNDKMSIGIIKLVLIGGKSLLSSAGLKHISAEIDDLKILDAYEQFDIDSYNRFISIIDPDIHRNLLDDQFWSQFLKSVFVHSLLYEKLPKLSSSSLQNSQFEHSFSKLIRGPRYGSTGSITPLPRMKMSYHCLGQLFSLSVVNNSTVAAIAVQDLVWRVALTLDGYVADQPLRGKLPVLQRQRKELKFLFESLLQHEKENHGYSDEIYGLYPLITQALPVAQGDRATLVLLQDLLLRMKSPPKQKPSLLPSPSTV